MTDSPYGNLPGVDLHGDGVLVDALPTWSMVEKRLRPPPAIST